MGRWVKKGVVVLMVLVFDLKRDRGANSVGVGFGVC